MRAHVIKNKDVLMAKKNKVAPVATSCRSLRAVEEFSCIGGDCENTCCQNWKVNLTKKDYVVWRNLAKKHPSEHQLFEKYVIKEESEYASLEFDEKTGSCPFHGDDGLCRVQKNLGQEALPSTCRTFPKAYNVEKTSIQANATLGCPEYLRNVLADDAATDIVEVGIIPAKTNVMHLASAGDAWHWKRCLPEISELGLSLVKASKPRASLAERLFVVAMMMSSIEDMGNSPSNPLPLPLLSQKVLPFLEEGNRAEIIDGFRELSVPQSNLSLQFVVSMFAYLLTIEWKNISKFWDGIYASYKEVAPAELKVIPGQSFGVNVESIAPLFYERRRKLHARAGKDLQRWYARAFCNQFYIGGTGTDETPLAYLGRHLLTIMMYDFAICSHEDIDSLLTESGPLNPEQHLQLQRHVVNIIHRVSRTALHVSHLSSSLATVMQEQQVDAFALVATMLKDLEGGKSLKPMKLNPVAAMMR